ncbi:hypothetical protein, partial [Staphylococcus epidermidis]|uniref:hypothetical protein n=1 Tax=Staphylococcus epidermidis TaxID=1282 RepID=UPI0016426081
EVENIYNESIEKGGEILKGSRDDVLKNNKIGDGIEKIHLSKKDLDGDEKLGECKEDGNNELNDLDELSEEQ